MTAIQESLCFKRFWAYHRILLTTAALMVFTLALLARLRLVGLPFERDEGEYAYAGWLITKGVPPYLLAYNMKLPGVYLAYALIIAVAGSSSTAIHVGLLLVALLSTWFAYLFVRRVAEREVALLAAAASFLLAASPSVLGLAAHATHFVILCVLAGFVTLERASDSKLQRHWLLGGVLLGLSFLMKQHAAVLVALGIAWPWLRERYVWERGTLRPRFLASVSIALGVLLPIMLTVVWLAWAGVLGKALYWTVDYARAYVNQTSFSDGMWELYLKLRYVSRTSELLWRLSAIGFIVLWWRNRLLGQRLLLLALAAFFAVVPGLYFRPHYFIVLLPFVAIAAVMGTMALASWLAEKNKPLLAWLVVGVVLVAVFESTWRNFRPWFLRGPNEVLRQQYHAQPFPEAPLLGQFIAAHTGPADTIGVIGSEPELMAYAQRRSATGYLYLYPLLEAQPFAAQMEQEFIAELATAKPRLLLLYDDPGNFDGYARTPKALLDWALAFARTEYRLLAVMPYGADPIAVAPLTDPAVLNPLWDTFDWCLRTSAPACDAQRVLVLERRDCSDGGA